MAKKKNKEEKFVITPKGLIWLAVNKYAGSVVVEDIVSSITQEIEYYILKNFVFKKTTGAIVYNTETKNLEFSKLSLVD